MQLPFQLQLTLRFLAQTRIVPKAQFFFQLFMFIILNLIQFKMPKLGIELINIFDLVCFFSISLSQLLVQTLDILNSLNDFLLAHLLFELFTIIQSKIEFQSISDNHSVNHAQLYNNCCKQMKGRPALIEIGRALAQSKQKSRKEACSLQQRNSLNAKTITPAAVPQIYQHPVPTKRKITMPYPNKINTNALISGMNDQFLFMRKQNYLNSCFNVRKNKLKQISKENKQIHKRLLSQKSIYSSTDFDKSFEQIIEIKKRLSQSRLSSRLNSSRSSSRGALNTQQNKRFQPKKKDLIRIKASNINDAKGNQLKGFKGLFNEQPNLNKEKPPKPPQKSAYNSINQDEDFPKNMNQSYRKTLPARNNHDEKVFPVKAGGILHRIAEVMYSGKETAQSKGMKGYMKPKKTYAF